MMTSFLRIEREPMAEGPLYVGCSGESSSPGLQKSCDRLAHKKSKTPHVFVVSGGKNPVPDPGGGGGPQGPRPPQHTRGKTARHYQQGKDKNISSFTDILTVFGFTIFCFETFLEKFEFNLEAL